MNKHSPMGYDTDRLKHVQERRAAVVRDMQAIMDKAESEKRSPTADELTRHTQLFNQAEAYRNELRTLEEQRERDRAEATRFINQQDRSAGAAETWMDVKTGATVPVLTKDQRVAHHVRDAHGERAHDGAQGIGFGQTVRALLMGPRNEEERDALATSPGTSGGYAVPSTTSAMIIDKLRDADVLTQAGMRTAVLDSAEMTLARLTSDPSTGWHLENVLIDDSTGPAFGAIVMRPRTLTSLVKLSRELLEDAANVDEVLTSAIASSMMLEVQRAAIYGDGSGGQPTGLLNQAAGFTIPEIAMGGNGATISYDKLIDSYGVVIGNNSPPPTGMVMASRTRMEIAKLKDGEGQYIENTPHPLLPPTIYQVTNAIRTDETQGSATNASRIIAGYWPNFVMGVRSGLTIDTLRERYAEYHQVAFLAHMRVDFAVLQEKSFCQISGIIPF